MIRDLQEKDIPRILDIWLDSNLEAHHFISDGFWFKNLPFVETTLPQSEVYVCLFHDSIVGFIGLSDDFIEGLFVASEYRSQGIGKQLLDYVKQEHHTLKLNVYIKNMRAVDFYKRNGFHINTNFIDEQTGENNYEMIWSKWQVL